MADEVQITVGADLGGALSALNALKQAATGAVEPVTRLKSAFADAGTAAQRNGAAALSAFRADMQAMVAQRALSSQQAIGFDIEYTAQRSDEERARLEQTLATDAATLAERTAAYSELVQLSSRYTAQLAQDQRRLSEAAQREADQIARPYRQAFDEIGAGGRAAITGLIEHTMTYRSAALEVSRSVTGGVVSMAQTTVSRAAAGPLASALGQGTPTAGEGVGDVLGNAVGRWLSGAPQQMGQAAASAANTAALTANTAALGTLAASLGGAAATGAASVAGGTAAGATAAGSGGLFGYLGSLFAFAAGGIVPSAKGGWALPNFTGATPALLHAREMVLPAPISEGLQNMIARGTQDASGGAGGGDMHLHFHGPSDGPSVQRWFTGLMGRNPQIVRNMLRSNSLTPRTL